jgi:hypothetical protein
MCQSVWKLSVIQNVQDVTCLRFGYSILIFLRSGSQFCRYISFVGRLPTKFHMDLLVGSEVKADFTMKLHNMFQTNVKASCVQAVRIANHFIVKLRLSSGTKFG